MKITLSSENWKILSAVFSSDIAARDPNGDVYVSEREAARMLDLLLNTARELGRWGGLIQGREEGFRDGRISITAHKMAEANAPFDAAEGPAPAHPGWLVFNPNGRQPNYQHPSIAAAETEAQRLADTNPDQPFYVYGPLTCARSRRIVVKSKPVPVPLKTEVDLDDEIPF